LQVLAEGNEETITVRGRMAAMIDPWVEKYSK
jgi:hypothetical protein